MSRIAIIHKERCNPEGCGHYLCIRVCPINRKGEECIYVDTDKKAGIAEDLCIGCMICVHKCPFDAISVINLPEELKAQPIHQFGRNGFHLYNLPIPISGKVVGILGVNGIGKSTAVKILAGVLKPNLGNYEKKEGAGNADLIKFFKGSEAQNFFEKMKKGEIIVSYKPQQVELIPKGAKGNVKGLLKKVDQKGEFERVVKELELGHVLDTDIGKISGGELQRVAIAATVLKKANVYFFDEPSSFLDIKQRIKVSSFIGNLADEDTAVMVVEHDLIILDYMTDLINVMYGKEECYGIVGGVKATRTGMNAYLDGYIREENVRFRDHAIKFLEKPPVSRAGVESLTSWKGIKKKLGQFSLSAESGEIFRGDVIGIMGENGTGKTTFVKILAGVEKADSGEIEKHVKVSYKPQYIEADPEEVVASAVSEAVQKYEIQLIRPLNIKPLLQRKLGELSGGELQRVAIARCLSQDAELYLLDEPSAYLDAEQRLNVSTVISNFMEMKGKSAVVVDHDLLFLDYISKRLMVFSGIPGKDGKCNGPYSMEEGMSMFLRNLNISLRRDAESRRPRINKLGSVKDREQKSSGKLYYQ
ncbi:MAG TPA: ribosome biogenesis/translation initiation ATPase RLI [Candidatus Nanoarchaeia archaeon]|nr:ribosome biogenesis/translation initiation ATPase RLI [Candidatus Nanoarchaeia archaeon]